MISMKEFIYYLKRARQLNLSIEILIKLPNLEYPEVICNPPENIEQKIKYYEEAYDDELKLKTNPSVSIIGYKISNRKFSNGENTEHASR